ncbi:hypothetical protein Gogos_003047 [Gossypium gossypioides]|uniref:Uncharacterized protein n=1 Tax=Gossypium gossypioides TaxID=34282 RepID=A0A7J9CKY9_GOSGO|nr:hypothetical protein [Gossypium gossypioides]
MILRIPLAKFPHDDFMVWRGESMGEFTGRKKSGAQTVKFIKQYIHELIELDRKNLALSPDSNRWRPPQSVTVGRDLGITHAEIERDCLTVIKKVQNT